MFRSLPDTTRTILAFRPVRASTAGVVLAAVLTSSCLPADAAPPSDPELRAELGIADDIVIHRVDLSASPSDTRILPRRTEIRRGGIVQFVALDHRVHLIRFDGAALSAPALDFLRASGQDRPAPLLREGARLVLTFDGAPAGAYPFRVEGPGGSVPGEIRVTDSASGTP